MVNSGSFDSDEHGDRNAKPSFIQSNNSTASSQSSSPVSASSMSLCKTDFSQTADSGLPSVAHAIEPTPTKTEFNSTMPVENYTNIDGPAERDLRLNVDEESIQSEDDNEKASLCCSLPLDKVQGVLTTYHPPGATKPDDDGEVKVKQLSRKLLCLYCDRTFVSANLRQKHVERCHSLKQNRRVSSRRQNSLTVTPCVYCDKLNTSEHTLKDLFHHLINDHSSKYFGCFPCDERFLTPILLADHNVSLHQIPAPESAKIFPKRNLLAKTNQLPSIVIAAEVESDVIHEGDEEIPVKITRSRMKSKTELLEEAQKSAVGGPGVKKSKLREMHNKKLSVKGSRIALKRSKRLQSKIPESQKNKRPKKYDKKNSNLKSELTATSTKTAEKSKSSTNSINPYPEFDSFFRVKKITDHSIDNLKISSLTFDDVFDKAFFNRIKCNIQENLLHHIDGKLFKNEESETRISNFEKISIIPQEIQNANTENFGCELSLNAVTPVASLSLTSQFGEDFESQIEYGSKPSKKKSQPRQDEVHYKYFTRRKYQASILEHKENRDLSKLDMWTQLVIKKRQQKMLDDKKTAKEILEYTTCEEYKNKIKREELNRILDRRGPFEDLKEEASKKAALDKLNSSSNDSISEESFSEVREVLNEILSKVFEITEQHSSSYEHIQPSKLAITDFALKQSHDYREIPSFLNLRRSSSLPSEGEIDKSDKIALICSSQETENFELPTNTVRGKNEMVELTGEWARCRMYICAACGGKLPNMKLLLDHKSVYHQNVWAQHYEFVGNQSELYRHLSIPGLGKVGVVEKNSVQCKLWKRSDARICTKCGKQCNSLGELHRHILECGGDWTWMLARKKCKYRPYGAKSRRKRRGLVKRIHHTQKTDRGEKKSYKKTFDGPRQRPSDADTIQRMLANLPAKRSTRKLISLHDGIYKARKNNQINSNKKQTKIKCGKVIYRNSNHAKEKPSGNGVVTNNGQKNNNKTTNNRKSLRSLNKVLSSRILDTNSTLLVKRKLKNLGQRVTRQSKNDLIDGKETVRINENVKDSSKNNQDVTAIKLRTSPKLSKPKQTNDIEDEAKPEEPIKRSSPRLGKPAEIVKEETSKKKLSMKKLLTGKIDIKTFFPVKKKRGREASSEPKTVNSEVENSDIATRGKRRAKETQVKPKFPAEAPAVDDVNNKVVVKNSKKEAFSKLVRSFSLNRKVDQKKKVKPEVETLVNIDAVVVTAAAASIEPPAEDSDTVISKKRKLTRSFRSVIKRVKKAKTETIAQIDGSSSDTTKNVIKANSEPFLDQAIPEKSQMDKIVTPSTLEKNENIVDIIVPDPIVINYSDSKEDPPIPETIFNLESNNEKSLQAKGAVDFDVEEIKIDKINVLDTEKTVLSDFSETLLPDVEQTVLSDENALTVLVEEIPSTEKLMDLCPSKAETVVEAMQPIIIDTILKTPTTPLVSPKLKGKLRKPTRGLNDCIAMLTSKLQQKTVEDETPKVENIFNLAPSEKSDVLYTDGPIVVKKECILRIPSFKQMPKEQVNYEETALDLTKKTHTNNTSLENLVPSKAEEVVKPQQHSFNSIDKIIEAVVENSIADVVKDKFWSPIDNHTIQPGMKVCECVLKAVSFDVEHLKVINHNNEFNSRSSVDDTINFVAVGGGVLNKNSLMVDSPILIKDTTSKKEIRKIGSIRKLKSRKGDTSIVMEKEDRVVEHVEEVKVVERIEEVAIEETLKDNTILNVAFVDKIEARTSATNSRKNGRKLGQRRRSPKTKIMQQEIDPQDVQRNEEEKMFLETDIDSILSVQEVQVQTPPGPSTAAIVPRNIFETNLELTNEDEPHLLENKIVVEQHGSDSEDDVPLAVLLNPEQTNTNPGEITNLQEKPIIPDENMKEVSDEVKTKDSDVVKDDVTEIEAVTEQIKLVIKKKRGRTLKTKAIIESISAAKVDEAKIVYSAAGETLPPKNGDSENSITERELKKTIIKRRSKISKVEKAENSSIVEQQKKTSKNKSSLQLDSSVDNQILINPVIEINSLPGNAELLDMCKDSTLQDIPKVKKRGRPKKTSIPVNAELEDATLLAKPIAIQSDNNANIQQSPDVNEQKCDAEIVAESGDPGVLAPNPLVTVSPAAEEVAVEEDPIPIKIVTHEVEPEIKPEVNVKVIGKRGRRKSRTAKKIEDKLMNNDLFEDFTLVIKKGKGRRKANVIIMETENSSENDVSESFSGDNEKISDHDLLIDDKIEPMDMELDEIPICATIIERDTEIVSGNIQLESLDDEGKFDDPPTPFYNLDIDKNKTLLDGVIKFDIKSCDLPKISKEARHAEEGVNEDEQICKVFKSVGNSPITVNVNLNEINEDVNQQIADVTSSSKDLSANKDVVDAVDKITEDVDVQNHFAPVGDIKNTSAIDEEKLVNPIVCPVLQTIEEVVRSGSKIKRNKRKKSKIIHASDTISTSYDNIVVNDYVVDSSLDLEDSIYSFIEDEEVQQPKKKTKKSRKTPLLLDAEDKPYAEIPNDPELPNSRNQIRFDLIDSTILPNVESKSQDDCAIDNVNLSLNDNTDEKLVIEASNEQLNKSNIKVNSVVNKQKLKKKTRLAKDIFIPGSSEDLNQIIQTNGEIKENSINSIESPSGRRKISRNAKSKALENIHDDALSEWTESERNRDVIAVCHETEKIVAIVSDSSEINLVESLDFGKKSKRSRSKENKETEDADGNIVMDIVNSNKQEVGKTLPDINGVPVADEGHSNDIVNDSDINNKNKTDKNKLIEQVVKDQEADRTEDELLSVSGVIEDSDHLQSEEGLRRSRRSSRKITSYNENELADPLLDVFETGKRKSKKKEHKSPEKCSVAVVEPTIKDALKPCDVQSKCEDKKGKQLNSDELFDLLKASTDNIYVPKTKNSFLDNLEESSREFIVDNFETTFDNILEKPTDVIIEDNLTRVADKIYEFTESSPESITQPEKSCVKKSSKRNKLFAKVHASDSDVHNNDNSCSVPPTTDSQGSDGTKTIKSITEPADKPNYCEICNKSFIRVENLIKHKRTLTHISKLSEIEAKEAQEKAKLNQVEEEEVLKISDAEQLLVPVKNDDINISDILQNSPKEKCESPTLHPAFAVNTNNRSLKLADIINDVLNKPVLEGDPEKHNTFSDIIMQNTTDVQPEFRRYKSLGERKSFDSENPVGANESPSSYYEQSISKTTLEKQISLLQNMIENQTGVNYIDDISMSSNQSTMENQLVTRNPSELSINSLKQDESSNITFINSSTNNLLIKPTAEDSFLKPSQYEEISEDSVNLRNYDEQKLRKTLNRDEELFIECCSLLKSGSEVSSYSKKSHKNIIAKMDLRQCDEPEWLERKSLSQKPVFDVVDDYSDNSRVLTPLGDSCADDASNSNTISSNWEMKNPAFDEVSVDKEENKSFSFEEVLHNEIEKHEEKTWKNSLSKFGGMLTKTISAVGRKITNRKIPSDDREYHPAGTFADVKKHDEFSDGSTCDSKKMLTKGAMKVFEGLKVSIPTEELNLEEVLNCSPRSKKIDLERVKSDQDLSSTEELFSPTKPSRTARKSKPVKNKSQFGSKLLFKKNKKMVQKGEKKKKQSSEQKKHDVYDFEETQDNTDVFVKPDFRSFRSKKPEDGLKNGTDVINVESDNDSQDNTSSFNTEMNSTSSVSSQSNTSMKKPKSQENITKKKCMIMGRIFKNAVKSKVEEEIRHVAPIDNSTEIVESIVLNCSETPPKQMPCDKPKMSEQEMDSLFDKLLNEKAEEKIRQAKIQSAPKTKSGEHKKKIKLKRKRVRGNSESTDDEFSINKAAKKRPYRKNAKVEDNCINLEQELKECIGVASRKSQRKCTSGKQNVLMEYWSSDDSAFEALLESQKIEYEQKITAIPDEELKLPEVSPEHTVNLDGAPLIITEMDSVDVLAPVVNSEKLKPLKPKNVKKRKQQPSGERKLKSNKPSEVVSSNRRKRAAVNPLYHWSSSSDDESQDLIQVKPIRDEIDDEEDRPVQHGWIVGDSPKKLVTMLAQAKGSKKIDADCVKEQGKKRTNAVS